MRHDPGSPVCSPLETVLSGTQSASVWQVLLLSVYGYAGYDEQMPRVWFFVTHCRRHSSRQGQWVSERALNFTESERVAQSRSASHHVRCHKQRVLLLQVGGTVKGNAVQQ